MQKVLFCFLFLSGLVSCKKDEIVVNNGLVGKWQLTELYSSPGDGSGSWSKAPYSESIDFRPDGQFVALGGKSSFKFYTLKLQDSTIVLYNNDSTQAEKYTVRLRTNNSQSSQLELSYFCIEGCAERYKAIK